MNKEFYISLGILPKDDQPESDATECYLTMNADVKDRSIVWQGIVKVKINSYVPKYDLMIHKGKIYFQVNEPYGDMQWVDFKMQASTTGKMNLRFEVYQGRGKICDDIRETVIIKDSYLEWIILKLSELNFLPQSDRSNLINEMKQKLTKISKESEQTHLNGKPLKPSPKECGYVKQIPLLLKIGFYHV